MQVDSYELDGKLRMESLPGGNLMLTLPNQAFVTLTPEEWDHLVSAARFLLATEPVTLPSKLGWLELRPRRNL